MDESSVRRIFQEARNQGRTALTEPEAKQALAAAGIAITKEAVAHSAEEAAQLATKIGFPVVLKVVSPDILHKSDSGGVIVGIETPEATQQSYNAILSAVAQRHPQATIQGVLVQEMLRGGVETIVGISNDPQFGPVVAFGLGGIFVEILKDVTFRVAPIDEAGALEMLGEIQAAQILDGYRGSPPVDKSALARTVTQLSRVAVAFQEAIKEIDINPLFASSRGAVAMDALILLKDGKE